MEKKEIRAVVRLTKQQIKLLRRALMVLDPVDDGVLSDILHRFTLAEGVIFHVETNMIK